MARTSLAAAAILCCTLAPAQNVAPAIVAAANTFLSSLDDAQRAKVLFDFNDAAQRVTRTLAAHSRKRS